MVDVIEDTFQTEVVERSGQVPVVVDLWAEWCGPCKSLGPILEKVIAATDGQVVLAKVDIDANPGIAQAFEVQSIPAVYALIDGKVVDGFIGAQPEAAVAEFVAKLLPTAVESEVDQLIAAGDEQSLRTALELEPAQQKVIVALATVLVDAGEGDEALELLARIPETAETRRLAALARAGSGALDDVETRLADLLIQVKGDDEARQAFVDLLELLGPDDPRTAQWRRKLTTALF